MITTALRERIAHAPAVLSPATHACEGECFHPDCIRSRRALAVMAAEPCAGCTEPTGYETPYRVRDRAHVFCMFVALCRFATGAIRPAAGDVRGAGEDGLLSSRSRENAGVAA